MTTAPCCPHLERRGSRLRPPWWWCKSRLKQVDPEYHCLDCENTMPPERTDDEMGLNWQGPAIDAVESGGSEPLWKWVQKEVAAGRSYDDIGEDLGIAGKTVEAGFYRYAGRPEEKSTVSHRPVLGRGSAPAVPTVLANLGFKPVERQLLSNRGKLGMFLSVQCSKGVPMRLTLSQELNRISGIEVGEALDAYENGDGQVAFAVGEGPLTVTRQGSSLGFTCPLLLEKLGIKPGQRLVAAYKDGFFIVDVRAETGG